MYHDVRYIGDSTRIEAVEAHETHLMGNGPWKGGPPDPGKGLLQSILDRVGAFEASRTKYKGKAAFQARLEAEWRAEKESKYTFKEFQDSQIPGKARGGATKCCDRDCTGRFFTMTEGFLVCEFGHVQPGSQEMVHDEGGGRRMFDEEDSHRQQAETVLARDVSVEELLKINGKKQFEMAYAEFKEKHPALAWLVLRHKQVTVLVKLMRKDNWLKLNPDVYEQALQSLNIAILQGDREKVPSDAEKGNPRLWAVKLVQHAYALQTHPGFDDQGTIKGEWKYEVGSDVAVAAMSTDAMAEKLEEVCKKTYTHYIDDAGTMKAGHARCSDSLGDTAARRTKIWYLNKLLRSTEDERVDRIGFHERVATDAPPVRWMSEMERIIHEQRRLKQEAFESKQAQPVKTAAREADKSGRVSPSVALADADSGDDEPAEQKQKKQKTQKTQEDVELQRGMEKAFNSESESDSD